MIETLAALSNDPEIIGRLNEISERVDSLKLQPWVTGLIGVLGAGLTAFLSTRGSLMSLRTDRRNKGQRDAIYGSQDSMTELLKHWSKMKDWREGGAVGDNPLSTHEELHLITTFEKFVTRVHNEELRSALTAWKDKARFHFFGYENKDGLPEVSFREEKELRQRAMRLAGEEVIQLD